MIRKLILIAIATMLLAGCDVASVQSCATGIVPIVPIRGTASDDGPIIDYLLFGEKVQISSAGKYYYVEAEATSGYVLTSSMMLVACDDGK